MKSLGLGSTRGLSSNYFCYNTSMKTVLITGASSGIGSAIAGELSKDDTQLILTATNSEKLAKLASSLKGKTEIIIADLSTKEGINSLIQKFYENHAALDNFVNVAGIWHSDTKALADIRYEDFDQQTVIDTLNVGTLAPMLLVHAFISIMKAKSKIINISGTFENGAKGWLPYFVSKKGIEDLTIGLAEELKDKDIQVNAISPSDTATEAYKKYFPQYIGEAIDPSEIGKYAVFLCSEEANGITGKVFALKKGKEPYEGYHT